MAVKPYSTSAGAADSQKSIHARFEELQGAVYVVEALMGVIVACGGNHTYSGLVLETAEAAQGILADIGQGLDSNEIGAAVSQ